MNKEQHRHEISATRVGGFGGSDAAMIMRIGELVRTRSSIGFGELPTYIRQRLAVAKGLTPYIPTPQTAAMAAGHAFEDEWGANHPEYEREVLFEVGLSVPFRIFAHVDFFDADNGTLYELKCTASDTDSVIRTYSPQLAWELWCATLNATKRVGDATIKLVHKSSVDQKVTVVDVDGKTLDTPMTVILSGVQWIADNWDCIAAPSDELMVLNDEQAAIAATFANYTRQIKILEDECKKARQCIAQMMETAHATKIEGDGFTIQYVAPTTRKTFDVKALQKKHPELDIADCFKLSNVSASIKINI